MVQIIGVNPCLTGVVQWIASGGVTASVPTATATATTASITPTTSAVPLFMLGWVVWGLIRAPSLVGYTHNVGCQSRMKCRRDVHLLIPMHVP